MCRLKERITMLIEPLQQVYRLLCAECGGSTSTLDTKDVLTFLWLYGEGECDGAILKTDTVCCHISTLLLWCDGVVALVAEPTPPNRLDAQRAIAAGQEPAVESVVPCEWYRQRQRPDCSSVQTVPCSLFLTFHLFLPFCLEVTQ